MKRERNLVDVFKGLIYFGLAIILLCAFSCRLFTPVQTPFDPYRDLTGELAVFPGAQGFGTSTRAGRGGAVFVVSNLNADGPGSLAAALSAEGSRTVVFEVGGIIELEESIVVSEPYLTLAGQTSPDPGITLVGAGIVIHTHDVLIQHIRVRPGDTSEGEDPENRDGISVVGDPRGETAVFNVVIDHCSVSWAIDEGMSTWYEGVRDVTFSHNIIAENLSVSLHPKGEHSKGLLIGDHSRRISVIGNIFAHNMRRNPLLKGDTSSYIANNLIYNGGTQGIGFSDGENSGSSISTIRKNVFIPGTDSAGDEYIWRGNETNDDIRLFLADNVVDAGVLVPFSPSPTIREVKVPNPPVDILPMTLLSTAVLEAELINTSGAYPSARDSIDQRIISDLSSRTGRIIDSQDEVGGYPSSTPFIRSLTLPSSPNGDSDGDGYTNLEEWLHDFARTVEGG